jgi:hypothetical protein
LGDERCEKPVNALDLAGQVQAPSAELAQCDAGGVVDDLTGAGTHGGGLGDQTKRCVVGESGADVIGCGRHQCAHLVDRRRPIPAAERFVTSNVRIAST